MNKVKVHNGNGYVRGNARKYAYFVAQVFEPLARKKDGVVTYRSTGKIVGPFRSAKKAEREGRQMADEIGADFVPGYGSLHGKVVEPVVPETGTIHFTSEGGFYFSDN